MAKSNRSYHHPTSGKGRISHKTTSTFFLWLHSDQFHIHFSDMAAAAAAAAALEASNSSKNTLKLENVRTDRPRLLLPSLPSAVQNTDIQARQRNETLSFPSRRNTRRNGKNRKSSKSMLPLFQKSPRAPCPLPTSARNTQNSSVQWRSLT